MADTEAPILWANFINNAVDISVDTTLRLNFNESIQLGAGVVEIRRISDGSLFTAIDVNDASQISVVDDDVLIDLVANFEYGTAYYVNFPAGTFADLAGNDYQAITGTNLLNFATIAAGPDTTGPVITRLLPPDGYTNVSNDLSIGIHFDETVRAGSGFIEIRKTSDNSLFKRIDAGDPDLVSFNNNQMSIHATLFAPGESYYLLIDEGAVVDLSGNAFAGILSTTEFNLSTRGLNSAPWITAFSPADNATGVAVDGNIVFTFNETIQAGAGIIEIRWGGPYSVDISVNDASQVSVVGNQLIIDPTLNLLDGTYYNVNMPEGIVQDLSGNAYYGIESPSAYNFTTLSASPDKSPPTLISSLPTDNAANVSVDTDITLNFDEAIRIGWGYFEFRKASDHSLYNSISVFDSSEVSISGTTVTIDPLVDFMPETEYYVIATPGIVEDFSDNPFGGIASPLTLNFTTAGSPLGELIDFTNEAPPSYMGAIRDFDGNNLGGRNSWLLIGSADIQNDVDREFIFVNDQIGRWATVGPADDKLVYFGDHSWGGDTRVVGIYIDPLVESGDVEPGSEFDSQRRFQNDLFIENINAVLHADDYDGDGLQEIYFGLTDETAYLHAYMHADGNIQYANYQSEQQVIDYLTANGFTSETWESWLYNNAPSSSASAFAQAAVLSNDPWASSISNFSATLAAPG